MPNLQEHERRKAKETEKCHHISQRQHEDRRCHCRVSAKALQAEGNKNARQARPDKRRQHCRADHKRQLDVTEPDQRDQPDPDGKDDSVDATAEHFPEDGAARRSAVQLPFGNGAHGNG